MARRPSKNLDRDLPELISIRGLNEGEIRLMRKIIIGMFGFLVVVLPQIAGAQQFNASFRYTAKFTCGYSCGGDCRLGVVQGHYNTTVNIQATRDRTALAYRATALRSDLGVETGASSGFSTRLDFDRDEGIGLVCRDIKNVLGVGGQGEGYIEGFVNIYSNAPIDAVSVLTAEGEGGLATMELLEAKGRATSQRVQPPVN
jgi:hypothetical protein